MSLRGDLKVLLNFHALLADACCLWLQIFMPSRMGRICKCFIAVMRKAMPWQAWVVMACQPSCLVQPMA